MSNQIKLPWLTRVSGKGSSQEALLHNNREKPLIDTGKSIQVENRGFPTGGEPPVREQRNRELTPEGGQEEGKGDVRTPSGTKGYISVTSRQNKRIHSGRVDWLLLSAFMRLFLFMSLPCWSLPHSPSEGFCFPRPMSLHSTAQIKGQRGIHLTELLKKQKRKKRGRGSRYKEMELRTN